MKNEIVNHLFIAGQSCWQNCRSAIGIYSFPLNWEQAESESIIDPFRQIPRTEWCRGLAVSAIALFTSCIREPENCCTNCTKPLITAYNFPFYCNPFPCKGFHFLFNLLTESNQQWIIIYSHLVREFTSNVWGRLVILTHIHIQKGNCVLNLNERERGTTLK